ncbi:MAG: 4Fe-4S binding protein [Candidatus Susulua stagnicola]|nr:4Fe-4S binding protein [Candidatus Susulua stagnicola]
MYSQKIVLHFPSGLVDKPIIYKLTKDFDLEFNILKAVVSPSEESLMVLELKGQEDEYKKAIKYLKDSAVKMQVLSQDVIRDEEKCVHCGLCVGVCPVEAFEVNQKDKKIIFHQEKCIACGVCVGVCPYKAMTIKF